MDNSIYAKCLERCLALSKYMVPTVILLFIKHEFELLKYLNDMKYQLIKREELVSLGIDVDFNDVNNWGTFLYIYEINIPRITF